MDWYDETKLKLKLRLYAARKVLSASNSIKADDASLSAAVDNCENDIIEFVEEMEKTNGNQ